MPQAAMAKLKVIVVDVAYANASSRDVGQLTALAPGLTLISRQDTRTKFRQPVIPCNYQGFLSPLHLDTNYTKSHAKSDRYLLSVYLCSYAGAQRL
jgi:hypothetical protein